MVINAGELEELQADSITVAATETELQAEPSKITEEIHPSLKTIVGVSNFGASVAGGSKGHQAGSGEGCSTIVTAEIHQAPENQSPIQRNFNTTYTVGCLSTGNNSTSQQMWSIDNSNSREMNPESMNERMRVLWPKYREPPVFNGHPHEDPQEWMRQYEAAAAHNGWDNTAKRLMFEFSFQGPSAKWWGIKKQGAPQHWVETPEQLGLKDIFLEAYQPSDFTGHQRRKLMECRLDENEVINTYGYDVLDMCRMLNPHMPVEEKIAHLEKGLNPELRSYMLGHRGKTNINEYIKELRIQAEACRIRNACEPPIIPFRAAIPAQPGSNMPAQDQMFKLMMDQLRELRGMLERKVDREEIGRGNFNRMGFNRESRMEAGRRVEGLSATTVD